MITFFTVGYARKDLDAFISELERNCIDVLVDVREYPLSRKKGFSKTPLAKALRGKGIEYWHFRELGSPKYLRKKYFEDGDFEYFEKYFRAGFNGRKDTLQMLLGYTAQKNLCLMCVEEDFDQCHRRILADEIIFLDGEETRVVHL